MVVGLLLSHQDDPKLIASKLLWLRPELSLVCTSREANHLLDLQAAGTELLKFIQCILQSLHRHENLHLKRSLWMRQQLTLVGHASSDLKLISVDGLNIRILMH